MHYPQVSISSLCELLGVNRAWYYARNGHYVQLPVNTQSYLEHAQKEEAIELRAAIEELVLEFPGYGYRRVTKALERAGYLVNHKRVLRVMREESLLCQLKRRFIPTTDTVHSFRTYPNLLKEIDLCAPDQAWQADITYIRLPTGFAYLAAILDSYSRRCVGWQFSRCIDTQLTLAALDMALSNRHIVTRLVHHSDRGAWGATPVGLTSSGWRVWAR